MNEVLATLASERLGETGAVHPNDQVNASQSSNDVFPSAMHVAAAEAVADDLVPALEHLARRCGRRRDEFATRGEVGPHAPDGRHAGDPRPGVRRLRQRRSRRRRAAAGRPAPRVPSSRWVAPRSARGINAPPEFAPRVIAALAERTGLPLAEAPRPLRGPGGPRRAGRAVGPAAGVAVALVKIANDLRWMGSGPAHRAGRDPPPRPPARVVDHAGQGQPRRWPRPCTQVAAQVIGNDAAVAFGGSQGAFELNVFLPVIARNLLESVRLLANVSRVFADKCVAGHRGQRGDLPALRRVVALGRRRRCTPTSGTRRRPRSSSGPWPRTAASARSSWRRGCCPRRRSTRSSTWRR